MVQLNDAMPKEVQVPEEALKRLVSLFKEGRELEIKFFQPVVHYNCTRNLVSISIYNLNL